MTTTSPPPSGHPTDDPDQPARRRLAFGVTLVAVLTLVFGWLYVLFVYDPGLMYDELADRTFPTQAEQICAAAQDQLALLPPAGQAANAFERADAVARSNVILSAMVDDLEPLVPTSSNPPAAESTAEERAASAERRRVSEGIQEWLDDWRVYIGNRADYVDNLRTDEDARFLETAKGGPSKGITRAIDGFAQVNRMGSCETPDDVS